MQHIFWSSLIVDLSGVDLFTECKFERFPSYKCMQMVIIARPTRYLVYMSYLSFSTMKTPSYLTHFCFDILYMNRYYRYYPAVVTMATIL